MLTRLERNRISRRNKRRFRLLIMFVIILVFISINHINNVYNSLVDATEANRIFAIEKNADANTIGIVFFGKELDLSMEFFIGIRDRWKQQNRK